MGHALRCSSKHPSCLSESSYMLHCKCAYLSSLPLCVLLEGGTVSLQCMYSRKICQGLTQDRGLAMPLGWMDNNGNVPRAHCVPGTTLSVLHLVTHVVCRTTLHVYLSMPQSLTLTVLQMGKLV